MDTSLVGLFLYEAGDLVRDRKISPVELTQAHLDRIEHLDGKINSFITLTAESALQRAAIAEEEARKGETPQGKTLGNCTACPGLERPVRDQGYPHNSGVQFSPGLYPAGGCKGGRRFICAGSDLAG
jgi:hypothetical protein